MHNRRPRSRGYFCATCALLALFIAGVARSVHADGDASSPAAAVTLEGEIDHAQLMRTLFRDGRGSNQKTPPIIPRLELDPDPTGIIATFQPSGPTKTSQSAFFQSLGTNDRTCFTCHQPQDAWTISAQHAQQRFDADPNDPLFRLVDGATCPSDDVSTPRARQRAFVLLLHKGLIRIGLPMPSSASLPYRVVSVDDPYHCNTNPSTGLTSATTGIVSSYRRPLPATNLGFLSAIMWDGREPDLLSQALDATLGHAQASTFPTDDQLQQIVNFEGCQEPIPQVRAPIHQRLRAYLPLSSSTKMRVLCGCGR